MRQETLARTEHVTFVALHRDRQLGDELLLGHRKPSGRERRGLEPSQLSLDQLDAVIRVVVVATEIDGHDAAVAVRRVRGFDVVRKAVFLPHQHVQHGVGRRAAEQIDEQCQRQPLRVVDPLRPSTDDAVRLVRMFGNDSGERFDGGGLPAREIPCGTFDVVQVAGDGRFDALGREVPDRRENHLVGGVRACDELPDRLSAEACQARFPA